MSARGREKREGLGAQTTHDYYATPPFCVYRALEAIELPGGRWIECCAGEGAIIATAQHVRGDLMWGAVEVRPECEPALRRFLTKDEIAIGDLLSNRWRSWLRKKWPDAQVVFSNPPFSLARECIEASLELAPIVVMLLRQNFLHTAERHGWLQGAMPDVYLLPERPSFVKMPPTKAEVKRAALEGREPRCGTTDACEYGFLVWRRYLAHTGKIRLLDRTPPERRLRWSESPELADAKPIRKGFSCSPA